MEIKRVQNECNLADIDFEFVIDSSGSVGATNWQITMDYIAQYWIQGKNNIFSLLPVFDLSTWVLGPSSHDWLVHANQRNSLFLNRGNSTKWFS